VVAVSEAFSARWTAGRIGMMMNCWVLALGALDFGLEATRLRSRDARARVRRALRIRRFAPH
jgi:hypothetical protein